MLDAALAPLRAQGILLEMSVSRRGPLHVLHCAAQADAGGQVPGLRPAVAAALAAWIRERREPELLRRILGTHYSYFSPSEREAILARAELGPEALPAEPQAALLQRRRAEVATSLQDYLGRHASVHLDGFVTFRLKPYMDALIGAVERAVDAFLLEREHGEFIALLRHVVCSRPDRPPVVHCLISPEGGAVLEDEEGQAVGAALLEDLGPVAAARDMALEDVLVSALITLAPLQVHLHLPDLAPEAFAPDARATLEAVFPAALGLCRGCGRCRRRAQG